MDVIIYGSRYGTARQYAEELARRTGADVFPYDEVDDADRYETIVYIGSLYAGGVLGMKKTFAKLGDCCGKRIVIATVGLADPRIRKTSTTSKTGCARNSRTRCTGPLVFFTCEAGLTTLDLASSTRQ